MQLKFFSIAVIGLLIFSTLTLNLSPTQEIESQNNSEILDDIEKNVGTRATECRSPDRSLIETNSHGGSWLDSFEDDSGIDWGLSDKLNLSNGLVKLEPFIHQVDSNVVALWHFDEGFGLTTYDETINNNDGNINGPTWTTGKFNNGLEFHGGGQFYDGDVVGVAHSNSLDLTGSFTIEAWIKAKGTDPYNWIVDKYNSGVGGASGYSFYLVSGQLRLNVYSGSNGLAQAQGPADLRDDKWHYVAGTYDGTEICVYIDGIEVSSNPWNFPPSSISYNLGIGKRLSGIGGYGPFNGIIDEVRISDIARSIEPGGSAKLISKSINIPNNMRWDSLIINKTQPKNTFINITILNATDYQPIPGSPKYIGDGEFDISYIDSGQYPLIKLNATLEGNGSATPTLCYWGVSWNASNAWHDTFYEGLKGTSQKLNYGDGEIWSSPSSTDWLKYQNNPILTTSSSGWDDFGVGRSSILFNGTGYMMWYEGRPAISGWDIGLATSPDGITWTKYSGNPVFTRGSGGKWDDEAIGCPCVLFDGTVYKMWYMGRSISPDWGIGYATSFDGINWLKHVNNPVLSVGAGGSWESKSVANSYVYYENGIYKMWYRGADSNNNHKVGYATSINGINWVKYSNNPVLVGPSGNNIGVNYLCVLSEKNRYLGWYSYNSGSEWMIYHATSSDGINWINYSNNPVLQKSSSGWDDEHTFYPFVALKNRQYLMYYQGNSQGRSQIGLAKSKFENDGNLKSTIITIPSSHYWDTLLINKTESAGIFLNITILDASTDQPLVSFENLNGNTIDVSSINPHKHKSLKLQADFNPSDIATPILFDWSVNWTQNRPPILLEFQSSSNSVYRTNTIQFNINVSDYEDTCNNLTVDIKYRSPLDTIWLDSYLNDLRYEDNYWIVNFTPSKNAEMGEYSFNVSCNDSFIEFDNKIFNNIITVLNNPPTKADVVISPTMPKTLDDLTVTVFNVTDIEDETITYYYEWYKDNELQLGLKTELVPSSNTAQNEVWKCIVTPNDGNENGTPGEAETIIQNTSPEINNSLLSVTFYEDTIDYSLNLSYTFKDSDYDELEFEFYGNDKLDVNIFENGTVELIPEPNWYGSETLTFYANDSLAEISDTVIVKVLPTNDEPVLIEIVGPKDIYLPSELIEIQTDEDEWLNLTVNAYDIDGDTLTYSTNRTDNIGTDDLNNLFIDANLISYLPTNDDVGFLTVNVTISDNNGSKIYQNLELEILNTNDPPSANIIYPTEGSIFLTTDSINFSCEWSDVDFNVPEPTEHLIFTWYTNQSQDQIGTTEALTNISLDAGHHQITIEVEDDYGAIAKDSINITVTPPPEVKDKTQLEVEALWWMILIALIIIIIILITLFIFYKRKKQAEEAAKAAAVSPGVLIPEIVGGPAGEPLPSAPTAPMQLQITPSVAPVPTLAPTPTIAPIPTPSLQGIQTGATPSLPPALVEEKEVPLAPADVASPVPAPVPKLKTTVIPTIIKPEITKVEQPPVKESTPPQPEAQPPFQEKPEELKVEPPAAICPQCQSSSITTYPDGSSSCSSCNYKWV